MRFLFILLLFFNCIVLSFSQNTNFKLVTNIIDSVKKIKTLRYRMVSMELIPSGFSKANMKVKLQLNPRKSYFIDSEKKVEVLYNEENSKTKCLVKPNIFPYVALNLDPRGSLMRKDQHFTIYELGFEYLIRTLVVAISKQKDEVTKHFTVTPNVQKNNTSCFLIITESPDFTYIDYTIKAKETITSIATKLGLNEYLIRHKNKLYSEYDYLKEGSVIKIPNHYSKKAMFYVNEKTLLPVSITVYDDQGLYETFDYYDIEVNTPIANEEFTKHFKGYGF